jgi:hypothetical protein
VGASDKNPVRPFFSITGFFPMPLTLNFTPQTELDAVNQMLMSIGKAPLESLDTTIKDVAFAQYTLVQTLREVLKQGWDFNSDYEEEITPTAGAIAVATDILDIRPSDRCLPYVQRHDGTAMAIYDREKKSFDEFGTNAIKFDVIRMFEFDEIPEAARAYIGHRAGRIFQANNVGSEIIYRFTKEREIETLADLQRSHTNNKRANLFLSPTLTGRIAYRQPGYRRIW